MQPRELDKPATFSGPLIREVLGYVEAAQVKTTFVAVNGYSGWLDPDDIKSSGSTFQIISLQHSIVTTTPYPASVFS